MDIAGLEYFVKAAELKNFTKAAKQCSITQTAMSQHIRNMEENLGFRLFDRNTRQVQLTPAGKAFYKEAKQLLEQYERAVNKGKRIADGKNGELVLALPGYIEGRLLMPRIRSFHRAYPDISLRLRICSALDMPTMLKKQECDVAVFWPYDFDREDADAAFIGEFRLELMCSPICPLGKKEQVELADLKQISLCAVDFSQMPRSRRAMEKQWASNGLEMPEMAFAGNIHSIEEAELLIGMDEQIGILVPSYTRSFTGNKINIIPLKEKMKVSLYSVVSKQNEKPETALLTAVLLDNRIALDY